MSLIAEIKTLVSELRDLLRKEKAYLESQSYYLKKFEKTTNKTLNKILIEKESTTLIKNYSEDIRKKHVGLARLQYRATKELEKTKNKLEQIFNIGWFYNNNTTKIILEEIDIHANNLLKILSRYKGSIAEHLQPTISAIEELEKNVKSTKEAIIALITSLNKLDDYFKKNNPADFIFKVDFNKQFDQVRRRSYFHNKNLNELTVFVDANVLVDLGRIDKLPDFTNNVKTVVLPKVYQESVNRTGTGQLISRAQASKIINALNAVDDKIQLLTTDEQEKLLNLIFKKWLNTPQGATSPKSIQTRYRNWEADPEIIIHAFDKIPAIILTNDRTLATIVNQLKTSTETIGSYNVAARLKFIEIRGLKDGKLIPVKLK